MRFLHIELLVMGIVYYMVIRKKYSISYSILFFTAVLDSLLNDDALKHNGNDDLNQTWVNLLKDLKVWENIDNHMMYLRTRWVHGCKEWLSGQHGSKENDKNNLRFNYSVSYPVYIPCAVQNQ